MKLRWSVLILISLLFGCTATRKVKMSGSVGEYAEVLQDGVINCFQNNIYNKDNEPIHCEASALFLSNDGIVIAEDKPIDQAGYSPVFTIPLMEKYPDSIPSSSVSFIDKTAFKEVKKIEAMTREPFGNICFASSDFSRISGSSSAADDYNSLIYWTDGDLNHIRYISATVDNGIKSSKPLRNRIAAALKSPDFQAGPPYFKIEGLCAIPDSTLLFGIREVGMSYKEPTYSFIVLSAKYHYANGAIELDSVFKKVYEAHPEAVTGYKMGLSSIAFNKFTQRLYFSTSYENVQNTSEDFFSYLWTLPLTDLTMNKPVQLLKDKTGKPIRFSHKIEGITFIDQNRIFAISDQDRNVRPVSLKKMVYERKPFQTFYTVLKLL